jgi:hypothetical protein
MHVCSEGPDTWELTDIVKCKLGSCGTMGCKTGNIGQEDAFSDQGAFILRESLATFTFDHTP